MSDVMDEVVKLKREPLAQLLTCSICRDLFSDPTTISECLHSFCRKCIYNKITDEEMYCCPVCKTDLGCNPLDKLRADNSLKNILTKIFGSETEKLSHNNVGSKAGSSIPPPVNPAKSLIPPSKAETSKPPPKPSKASRKKRRTKKKKSTAQQLLPRPINKGIVIVENGQNNVRSPDLVPKNVSVKGKEKVEDNAENAGEKDDPGAKWFNSLFIMSSKIPMTDKIVTNNKRRTGVEAVSLDGLRGGVFNLNLNGNRDGLIGTSHSRPLNPKKPEEKRAVVLGITAPPNVVENNAAPNVIENSGIQILEKYKNSIWFWLTASHNIRKGYETLPQLPKPYLHVNNSDATVLSVRKYLVGKFNLSGEDEVEVMMRGQPLDPTLTLLDLIEMWIRTSPVKLTTLAIPGSSAKDFIMVLCYSRKKKGNLN